ncbi:glyoxalase superfamily protein [Falsihalocynthiibacter arcticus]|nr:glyoxalase superfamily protein [Falsihalocynthiibacter arcticus]
MSPEFPYLADLKKQAKAMRTTREISHSRALEEIAKRYGYRDWNTLVASAGPQPPVQVGQRVSGLYLQVPFSGKVLSLKSENAGLFRVNIEFDALIDVVIFDSFSNWKNRANKIINTNGVSVDRTTNGHPHMVVSL